MKKLINFMLLIALMMCHYSCIDCKDSYEPEIPKEEVETPVVEKEGITSGQEVDLGLSVKWAGWNIGATSPEEYGSYYAWGETEEKSEYSRDTYRHYYDADGDGNEEFINIGTNICGTQYDVATVKWGDGWRLPTLGELYELSTKCRYEGYTYKGVRGCRVIGPNGNSIFLPPTELSESSYRFGLYGYYWGGACVDNAFVRGLEIDIEGGLEVEVEIFRYYGLTVRAVRD